MDALKHFEYKINERIRLTIIDIDELDEELIKLIDDSFVEICEGKSGSDLSTVKKRVYKLYSEKKDIWKIGATAEFFIHLFIRLNGYKQECLFLNLEENSIKKGFDGFYSIGENYWLMESKAGSSSSEQVTHSGKVLLAMADLSDRVFGKKHNLNNPWQEAYSHACHCDVGTAKRIRDNIKVLANEYVNDSFHPIEEFNTMPCGTLFLSGVWIPQDHDAIKKSIIKIADRLSGKRIHVICVTHKTLDLFSHYIQYN